MKRRILLTAALPYANGDIHIGHLVEYIQADIWSRFQKMRGHECWFVCADDAHGTPIMLRAEAENVAPEILIKRMQAAHERDFAAFGIAFDNYHSTHGDENRVLSEGMFNELKQRGYIVERDVQQLYDAEKNMFLPDRYVRGDCPRCLAANQYGDSCESCGNVYDSTDLKNPVSALSGTTPVIKSSLHYFLRLSGEEKALESWINADTPDGTGELAPRLQREAANKLREWLREGLRDWDISRDPPYFGFRIPDTPTEKYFYVWLDAPIGYIASFRNLCDKRGNAAELFDDFWRNGDSGTELYHFIGKDILYFHGLFWPIMLQNSGYRLPTRLFAHGFLTVNGEKMSKSRGTFITAARYLQSGLDADALRYYYACKLGDRVEDIDLNLNDFLLRVNSDLVGKLVNIPSRTAAFIHRFFGGELDDRTLPADAFPADAVQAVAAAYENRRYHEVVRLVMKQADIVNARLEEEKPWLLAKDEESRARLHAVCSDALRHFDLLVGYLSPVLPRLSARVVEFLNREAYQWRGESGIAALPAAHRINKFSHLMKRLEEKDIAAMTKPEEEKSASSPTEGGDVTIGDFAKLDLRVAVVLAAEAVPESDKLLKLKLDVGGGDVRQVFAGIKKHYSPEQLLNKQVLCFVNLKPRKMRFGVSEGMVLAASDGDSVVLMQPQQNTAAGAKVS